MREFILKEYKNPLGRPPQRIIFTKNEYCEGVKMHGWDVLREGEPKDHDPHHPPCGSQTQSTYKRLGNVKEGPDFFKSTTLLCTEQIKDKKDFLKPDNRPMIHYLTFRDTCQPRKPRVCPVSEDCAYDYLTTMQNSYKMPHPGVLQPLSTPIIPHLQFRRVKFEESRLDENKFFDDCYIQKMQYVQGVKSSLFKSFDPATCLYTDGTPEKTRKRKCTEVPFTHVK